MAHGERSPVPPGEMMLGEALLLLVVYLALEIAVAKALLSPQLEAHFQEDVWAFLISLFLLAITHAVGTVYSPNLILALLRDEYVIAQRLSNNTLEGLFFLDLLSSASLKVGFNIGVIQLSQWFAPYEGLAIVGDALSRAFQMFYTVFINLQLLAYLSVDGVKAAQELFLPIGVVLYTFRPTRDQGAAILALSVAFLWVFPTLTSVLLEALPHLSMPPKLNIEGDSALYRPIDKIVNTWQMKACRWSLWRPGMNVQPPLYGNLLLGVLRLLGVIGRLFTSWVDTLVPNLSLWVEFANSIAALYTTAQASFLLGLKASDVKNILLHFFDVYRQTTLYPAAMLWMMSYLVMAVSVLTTFSVASNLKTYLSGMPSFIGWGKIL